MNKCRFCGQDIIVIDSFQALEPKEKDRVLAALWYDIKEKREKKEEASLGVAEIKIPHLVGKLYSATASVVHPEQVIKHAKTSHSLCNGKGFIMQVIKGEKEERIKAPCTCGQKNWLKYHPTTFQDRILGMWIEIKEFREVL